MQERKTNVKPFTPRMLYDSTAWRLFFEETHGCSNPKCSNVQLQIFHTYTFHIIRPFTPWMLYDSTAWRVFFEETHGCRNIVMYNCKYFIHTHLTNGYQLQMTSIPYMQKNTYPYSGLDRHINQNIWKCGEMLIAMPPTNVSSMIFSLILVVPDFTYKWTVVNFSSLINSLSWLQ